MQFGIHLRELWQHRLGLALSGLLALVVALSSIDKITLFPPGLQGRQLEIAAGSTRVLVDLERSTVADVKATTDLTGRAGLLGNVMASEPVRAYIGRSARIDPARIATVVPVTANVPRALTEPGSEKRASDILRSTDQYRLDIQVNPNVPIINIYSQAPSPEAAARLANGAVDGLRRYLHDLAVRQRVQASQEVRLTQLGRAQAGVINPGVGLQIAALSFLVVFGTSCCALLLVTRIRRGWAQAAQSESVPS